MRVVPTETFMRRFEVDRRTVQRDIKFFRDELKLPVEYDRGEGGYRYTEHVENFPLFFLSDEDFYSIVFLRQVLEMFRHRFFYDDLVGVLEKMVKFGGAEAIPVEDLTAETPLLFREGGADKLKSHQFRLLYEAIEGRKKVRFKYRRPETGEVTDRKVQPLRLVFSGARWYLLAWCEKRQDMRSFIVHRIHSCQMSGESFQPPQDFDAKHYFGSCLTVFGHQPDKKLYDIELDFDPVAADYLEETYFHPSMNMERLPDRHLRLKLKLNNLVEVTSFILRWGNRVRVIQPQELRERVCREAREFLKNNKG